jgi:hypothetical protein
MIDTSILIPVLSLILGLLGGFLGFWAKNARYQQKVERLEIEQEKTHAMMNEFRIDIATLKEFKVQAQKFIDKSIYKASSSLSLTELGQELVEKSGFLQIFEKEKDNLVILLAKKNPSTKYDTQEMARELMDNLKEYPAFTPIKSYAYTNGKDLGQILRAGAILLRDYYLSVHPEIKS